MEYLLLPKLYGFAERAWAAGPAWATEPDEDKAAELYAADWSIFLNRVAKRELPRASHYAGGFAYRIPTVGVVKQARSEEHQSELQSLMRISYAVFCLNKKLQHLNTKDCT